MHGRSRATFSRVERITKTRHLARSRKETRLVWGKVLASTSLGARRKPVSALKGWPISGDEALGHAGADESLLYTLSLMAPKSGQPASSRKSARELMHPISQIEPLERENIRQAAGADAQQSMLEAASSRDKRPVAQMGASRIPAKHADAQTPSKFSSAASTLQRQPPKQRRPR